MDKATDVRDVMTDIETVRDFLEYPQSLQVRNPEVLAAQRRIERVVEAARVIALEMQTLDSVGGAAILRLREALEALDS